MPCFGNKRARGQYFLEDMCAGLLLSDTAELQVKNHRVGLFLPCTVGGRFQGTLVVRPGRVRTWLWLDG